MSDTKRQQDLAVARIRQVTGRCYPKLEAELQKLSLEALMDLARFAVDAQAEVTMARNKPWFR